LDRAADAPLPETAIAGDGKTFGCRVPEPEMEFNGQRHFRIVIVAVGTPSSHPDHWGEMIDGDSTLLAKRLIAQRLDRFKGRLDRLRRAVKVQIILRAVTQVVTIPRPLCKSLEHDEVDTFRREGACHLLICVQYAIMPDRIVSQIP